MINNSKNQKYVDVNWDQILSDYNEGGEKRQNAIILCIDSLIGYITKLVQQNIINVWDFEDLLQEAKIAVIEALPKYNTKYAATTYFKQYIMQAMFKYNYKEKQSTSYYASIDKKVRDTIKKKEKDGLTLSQNAGGDGTFTIISLADELKLSPKNVSESLERINRIHVSTIPDMADKNTLSPEEEYLKKEQTEDLLNALSSLSDLELYVLCNHLGLNTKEKKYTDISKELELSVKKIMAIEQGALKKLKYDKNLAYYRREKEHKNMLNIELINFDDKSENTKILEDFEKNLDINSDSFIFFD